MKISDIFNSSCISHSTQQKCDMDEDLAYKLYLLCYKCNDEKNDCGRFYVVYEDELIEITCDDIYRINVILKKTGKVLLYFSKASDDFEGLSNCKQEILNIIYKSIKEHEVKHALIIREYELQQQLELTKICKHLHELNGE